MYSTIQKTLAAWAFNHYIAYYYFDNVNVNQLKVAFERGEVELQDLPIKKDALQHFNLPMEVISGVVGKLSIKVPLLTLLSDPWIINISDLMLIVSPKKLSPDDSSNNLNGVPAPDESISSLKSDLDSMQETADNSLTDYLENTNLKDGTSFVNSEENKLAEFYTSFTGAVSAMVRDIYKNIKLEIKSITVLFQDFDLGLVKFSVDSLLLHRPKSVRNLTMENFSLYLSSLSPSNLCEDDELIQFQSKECNLDIHDEASTNMQLVVVKPAENSSSDASKHSVISEIRIEGSFKNISVKQLIKISKNNVSKPSSPSPKLENGQTIKSICKKNILRCDKLKLDFKLNYNLDDNLAKLNEKNLHLKLDMVGVQYIHSQQIYDITIQRFKSLLRYCVKLLSKKSKKYSSQSKQPGNVDDIKILEGTSFNKLFVVNVEEGLLYLVDDKSSSCAIPLLELSLDSCRILQFSGRHQQNGLIFAKVSCCYYNREMSTWEKFLQPWPFNLSWDSSTSNTLTRRGNKFSHKEIVLSSDEVAEFSFTNAFLDLSDVALKRVLDELINQGIRPISSRLVLQSSSELSFELDSIFVLHNESGHKLFFCPIEETSSSQDTQNSSPSFDMEDNLLNQNQIHRSSVHSRTSNSGQDSADFNKSFKWISVGSGETIAFGYDTLPIYRRYLGDYSARSRSILVRVEGWKTLLPISIDKTGIFFREAYSDRVMNEDNYMVVSINLENRTARKVISIRSPLSLVNSLDTTLEVHFVESNHALYIKPDSHLSVPLPYLFDQIKLRPCNVGVTMSEQILLWDTIKKVIDSESKIHRCNPITVTNQKHASYCTSQPYRICVSTQRDKPNCGIDTHEEMNYDSVPAFTISFIPPLTIVNLLPCKLQFSIGETGGTLNAGQQQRINQIDTTIPNDVYFSMNGFPQSKPINIDLGATGGFHHSLEVFDKKNRILILDAEIIIATSGDEPAVQIMISAPYWIINKTRLPLIFKQEGAILEAAGQFREHEENPNTTLLFSFYDMEVEQPFLCSMRLGKSKGFPLWCEGFKLEKGSGERRLSYMPKDQVDSSKMSKSLIDISIRRGFGKYSRTMIVTLTVRYGFNPLSKTPKKASTESPHSYKLTTYNHNVNLAERIADRAINLFDNHHNHRGTSDFKLMVPGVKLALIDDSHEKLVEASVENITARCTTKAKEQILDCSIQDIRIDNVMNDSETVVLLDRVSSRDGINKKPAIRFLMDRMLGNSFGTTLFRQVQVSMCEFILNIEEKLVLKLVEFVNVRSRQKHSGLNNLSHDLDRILDPEENRLSKYYFDLLRIDLSSLKLSVFPSNNLSSSLQKLKYYLGLKFFGFEDAHVQLSPYLRLNVARTFSGVFDSVTRFYKRQILEQAPRIVGQQIQNYLRFHLSDLLSTIYDEVYNKLFN